MLFLLLSLQIILEQIQSDNIYLKIQYVAKFVMIASPSNLHHIGHDYNLNTNLTYK